MTSAGFRFKQFTVHQDRCAMKVGTDGVALGAWAPVEAVRRILDIGTGTGLIALMLAQRAAQAEQIVAVELDADAAAQAAENVAASPWANRIRVVHSPIQQFVDEPFDLIVSNPPYFSHGQTFSDLSRQQARHTSQLLHVELLDHACRLLAPRGRIALILPVREAEMLQQVAREKSLYLNCCQRIIPKKNKEPNRFLLLFSRENACYEAEDLVINADDGGYSETYREMVRAFYLKL